MADAQPAADYKPFADVLSNVGKPSLSAMSDMPPVKAPEPAEKPSSEAVDETAKPADSAATTEEQSVVEADAKPEDGVAGKDEPSPAQRAAFTREKNRRQAAESRAAALEQQMAQINEKLDKLTADRQAPKEEARPKREDFSSPEDHEAALETWAGRRAAEKALAAAKVEQQQQERDRRAKATLDTFTERKSQFEADHPDFDDVVYADDVKISPAMTQAAITAEDGPAIAYYLGQNPEVAERLYNIGLVNPDAPPAERKWTNEGMALQVYEIGKISAKLANPPKPKLAAPIKPISSRNTAGPKDPAEMDMAEYAAYRAEQSKKAR